MSQIEIGSHPGQFRGEERDIRVEDYLNDKLQTAADLDNLDTLLENIQSQQSLITHQVCY